jgi:hypothetical protein
MTTMGVRVTLADDHRQTQIGSGYGNETSVKIVKEMRRMMQWLREETDARRTVL